MRHDTTLDDLLKDSDYRRVFQQEKLILEVTESIFEVMEKTSTSKSALARLLSRTKGHVTQLLCGRRNLTLRTWADVMTALGHEVRVSSQPIHDGLRFEFTPELETELDQGWSVPSGETLTVQRPTGTPSDQTLAA